MFSMVKLVAIGLAALFIVSLVIGGYRYIQKMQNDLVIAQKNVATLTEAKAVQDKAIEALEKHQTEMVQQVQANQTALDHITSESNASQAKVDALAAELTKHDLGTIANAKPNLLQKRINAGTAAALRGLQSSSRGTKGVGGSGGAAKAPLIPPAATGAAQPESAR